MQGEQTKRKGEAMSDGQTTEKQYVGNGKLLKGKEGLPDRMKFGFSEADLRAMMAQAAGSGNGWCNIIISQRREVGRNGQTHYATIDTWQPTARQDAPPAARPAQPQVPSAPARTEAVDDSNLPF